MFTKTAITLVLLVGAVSTAVAAPKARSTNPAHDVYTSSGYAGSDPDPNIRAMLARDAE